MATEFPTTPAKQRNFAVVELALNCIFTVELLVKLIALQLSYFNSGWHWLDAMCVVVGWAAYIVEQAVGGRSTAMKVLRIVRVLRPLRALEIIPSLRNVVNAILYAVRDLGSTVLIILFFLSMLGIFFACFALFAFGSAACRSEEQHSARFAFGFFVFFAFGFAFFVFWPCASGMGCGHPLTSPSCRP